MMYRVAITGVGLISPLGDSSRDMFNALCEGRSGISELPQIGFNAHRCHLGSMVSDFQPEKYLAGRPLRPLDRTCQLAAAACGLALRDSGWSEDKRADVDFGVVLGTMFGGMHTIAEFDRTALTSGPASVSPMAFANTVISAAAGQAAIWHNLRGLNSTVAAGNISGIYAVGYGADLVRQGRSKALLAGGVDEFSLESFVGFDRAGLLCTNDGGKECPIPFERRRNGFALGEGAGFLVLEELNFAKARGAEIIGEVKGCGGTFDFSRGRNSDLAVNTLVRAMRLALARSVIDPADIDFVSASSNGSISEDCCELMALSLVFGDQAQRLPVTSIKCGIGETLGAAGPAQVAAVIETFRQKRLPGVTGLEQLPPGCPLGGIRADAIGIEATNALLNAVGLDGHCFSMVLASPDKT